MSERADWMDIIIHALGLTPRGSRRLRRWSYRNNYATDENIDGIVLAMTERGLMRRGRAIPGGLTYYHVTDAGAEFAGVNNRVRKEDRIKE